MQLRSVSLRDWKAFEEARFDFPKPDGERNIILIGGENGFGKTTLFEALALGLFGRDGIRLVSRAAAAADDSARNVSFRDFMERALNGRAIARGRTNCRITLTFEDDAGEKIEIERKWHFTPDGKLRAGDSGDEVRIVTGRGNKVVGPPVSESDPHGWYRDWVSRVFMPTTLAGFFLFDGEAASVYAERDMGQQVRDGIEGLLGLTWLRELADTLLKYADARRNEVPKSVRGQAIEVAEAEVATIERDLNAAEFALKEIEAGLAQTELEQGSLTRELAGYGTGTRAQLEELTTAKARDERAFQEASERLQKIAIDELPLALSGAALRTRVVKQLAGEAIRESWLASQRQGRDRADGVLESVETQLRFLAPPLVASQMDAVKEAVREALDQLWNPAPSGAAEAVRHSHAAGPMNDRVQQRLLQAAHLTSTSLSDLLARMARASRSVQDLEAAIRGTEVAAPELERKKARLMELSTLAGSLHQQKGAKSNFIGSRRPELETKRKNLARLTAQLDQSVKPARLANRAEEVARMLGDLVGDALPMQTEAVANKMTEAVRAMAHRSDFLNRVEITPEGLVRLLTPDGRDLREFDLAAGEKQVFTQALFSALGQVSGRVFPLVIDTPLGRLDEDHRINVLRHLAQRQGQVLLISTNTEVVGSYLDAIRQRVLKAYRIENQIDGSLGRSYPVEGYFPGQGL